jgi:SAM-dependent methyltransferase
MKFAITGAARPIVRRFLQFPLSWSSARKRLAYCKRRAVWCRKCLQRPKDSLLLFRCNICGEETSYPRAEMSRESWSCVYCGSNVRWRSVVHALSTELFGKSLPIQEFPSRPDLVGIGLSDWDGYAARLARKLAYTNTYYHQRPFLDITSVEPSQYGRYDFIIASDVFEHIPPPISRAFQNARRLLKAGGMMIFTVPYVGGQTREHFGELNRFSIQEKGGKWVLFNETSDGQKQEFSEVTFHGGPGSVLEMRLFGKDTLVENFRDAGFDSAHPCGEEVLDFGICWLPYVAEDAPYRPLIYGLDTPPWVVRNGFSNTAS